MSTVNQLKTAALDAVEGLYSACERDVEKLEEKITKLEEQVTDLEERYAHPEWGNCRRGCPPSYLDSEGFCSPACKLGMPRGEFVTFSELQPKHQESVRLRARKDQESRRAPCPDCGRERVNMKLHRGSKLCQTPRVSDQL